ncbi:MAG: Rdx family protein [Holophagales bacterium]|nr:Rdx family protein [Holophagales bacterium]
METELVKGSNGVFEVSLDGDLIFSKRSSGRFPDFGEVEGLVEGRLPA